MLLLDMRFALIRQFNVSLQVRAVEVHQSISDYL